MMKYAQLHEEHDLHQILEFLSSLFMMEHLDSKQAREQTLKRYFSWAQNQLIN